MAPGRLSAPNLLRDNVIFGRLGDAERAEVEREMVPMSVPGGMLLFARGEPADALYVVKSGSLGAFRDVESGAAPQLSRVVGSGDTIGALGLLTRRPRPFDMRALRDSELLRLPREGFEALIRQRPETILGAAQLALERLVEEDTHPPRVVPRTFAILPFDTSVKVRPMADELRSALLPYGDCLLMDARMGAGRESGWFAEREHEVRFVLYVDDGSDPGWRDLCWRQADVLLFTARSDQREAPWPDQIALTRYASWVRPRYLLLQHVRDIRPGAARRWMRTFGRPLRQHHVRGRYRSRDLARLARLLAGESRGLVISGGGARGFAAVGVVKALREAGIEIDAVGGTSIGAIVGAGVALEWDNARMYQVCHHSFVEGHPLADRTIPLVAFSRGRRSARLLREAFDDIDIEDMPLAYFCMVSNLTTGQAETHRTGRLWYWLRASSAIPGILPPVLREGEVHADGGIVNNLPTDIMRDTGLSRIIACDISSDDTLHARVEEHALPAAWRVLVQCLQRQRPGMLAVLMRSGMVNAEVAGTQRRALADWLLMPDVADIGLFEWKALDRAIETGYQCARRRLDEGDLA